MKNTSIITITAILLVFVSYQGKKQRDLDHVKIKYLSEKLYESRKEVLEVKDLGIKLSDICDKYKSSSESKRKLVMDYKILDL